MNSLANNEIIPIFISAIIGFTITFLFSMHDYVEKLIKDTEKEIEIRRPNILIVVLFATIKSIISGAFSMAIFSALLYWNPTIDYVIYYGVVALISPNVVKYVRTINRATEKKVEEKIDEL